MIVLQTQFVIPTVFDPAKAGFGMTESSFWNHLKNIRGNDKIVFIKVKSMKLIIFILTFRV